MTPPDAPKRPPGRPRNPPPPTPGLATEDGLADRIRAVLRRAVSAIEAKMDDFEARMPLDDDQLASMMKMAVDSGVLIGHVRRHDESIRNAGRKLSLGVVLSWCREQSPDVRAQIRDELDDDADEKKRSVLT